MKAKILFPLVAVTLALLAPQGQATPYFFEDFQGYTPGTVTLVQTTAYTAATFPITGFLPLAGAGLNVLSEADLDYTLWDENEGEGIIRWRVARVNHIGSPQRPQRLIYVGTDPENDPYLWEDYTARMVFSIDDTTPNHFIHLMARLQEAHDSNRGVGYSAQWHLRSTTPDFGNRLVIMKNGFGNYPDTNTVLAASVDTLALDREKIYTLEFILQGDSLTANLYEADNLTTPGTLKLTAQATDDTYTAGTVALASAVGVEHKETFFYSFEVIPEPTVLGLFGVAGVVLFSLRNRRRQAG